MIVIKLNTDTNYPPNREVFEWWHKNQNVSQYPPVSPNWDPEKKIQHKKTDRVNCNDIFKLEEIGLETRLNQIPSGIKQANLHFKPPNFACVRVEIQPFVYIPSSQTQQHIRFNLKLLPLLFLQSAVCSRTGKVQAVSCVFREQECSHVYIACCSLYSWIVSVFSVNNWPYRSWVDVLGNISRCLFNIV